MQPRVWAWSALTAAALTAGVAAGEPSTTPTPPTAEEGLTVPADEDPAYERYVSFKELAAAAEALDAAALTDAVLQFAEAERVLLRPHRSGVSSAQLLSAAIKLAGERRDGASLGRLASAAGRAGMKELEQKAAALKQVAATARDVARPVLVPLDSIDEAGLLAYRHLKAEIQKARLRGEKDRLKELSDSLPEWLALSDALKEQLKGEVADAAQKAAAPTDPTAETLKQLGGASRGTVAITLSDGTRGNVTLDPTAGGLIPRSTGVLVNGMQKAVLFDLMNPRRLYQLQPGKRMSFVLTGTAVATNPQVARAGVVAVDFSGAPGLSMTPPILWIGTDRLPLANGTWVITNSAGANSFAGRFRLQPGR